MLTSFARTSQILTCTYLGFASHNTCTHMQEQKHTHTHTHTRTYMHASLQVPRYWASWKVRFASKINPALLSASNSILLGFHKIIRTRFAVLKSRVNASQALLCVISITSQKPASRAFKFCATMRLKLHFTGFL